MCDMTLSAWWHNAVSMPICPRVKGGWVRMPSREPASGMGGHTAISGPCACG